MSQSIMAAEAAQTPHVIASQLEANQSVCRELVASLTDFNPRMIMIIGRGSSDHAGVFAKYLFEVEMGLPVCAAAPSVSGVYQRQLRLDNTLAIVISQSGRSPDILKQAESAKAGGAFTVALVNDETSPLAELADAVLPIRAGEEKAVAATKSYLATLSALLQLCAIWSNNTRLQKALLDLPDALKGAIASQRQLKTNTLINVNNAVVLGRGFGYAVGREVALKLKEVLSIHAEAFSSAEFIHGPVTLVERKLHIVDLHIEDESAPFHKDIIADVESRGASLQTIFSGNTTLHPRLQPLLVLQRFYLDIEAIAVELGYDPDQPPGLNKVTKTV